MTAKPNPAAIADIDNPESVRVVLYASTQPVHAPLTAAVSAGAQGKLLPDGGDPGDVLTKNVDGTPEWGRIEADDIATTAGGTFEGGSVEDVLDDHEGRIADVEAEAALAVRYDAQSASSGEQAQARQNLGFQDGASVGDTFQWNGTIWVPAPAREVLTANRTYYVSLSGNDSNTGLDTGDAFQTFNRAIDQAAAIDLAGNNVTIQLANGDYTGQGTTSFKKLVGGNGTIQGNNPGSPGGVICDGFANNNAGTWTVQDLRINASNNALSSSAMGDLRFGNLIFGTAGARHISVDTGGIANAIGNYTIAGNASQHVVVAQLGLVFITGRTITLTGTPAFSNAFILAMRIAVAEMFSNTFNGAATGRRYTVVTNSYLNSGGGGANYLPGDVAGVTNSGGIYE